MRTPTVDAPREWRALALVAALALGGCAADPHKVAADLDRTAPCCPALAALPFTDLAPGQSVNASFGSGAPVFDFAQGRSYLAAYRLAAAPRPRRLGFVVALERVLGGPYTVFALSLTELDEAFNPIAFATPALSYESPGLVTSATFRATHALSPAARHVVLHAAAERVGKPLVYVYRQVSGGYPVFLGGRAGAIWVPGGTSGSQTGMADLARSGHVTTTLLP